MSLPEWDDSEILEFIDNGHTGTTEIEALNQPFDPNFMNAVQQVPAAEGQESGRVVQVFQEGYKIGDKIIRHAMVVVAE